MVRTRSGPANTACTRTSMRGEIGCCTSERQTSQVCGIASAAPTRISSSPISPAVTEPTRFGSYTVNSCLRMAVGAHLSFWRTWRAYSSCACCPSATSSLGNPALLGPDSAFIASEIGPSSGFDSMMSVDECGRRRRRPLATRAGQSRWGFCLRLPAHSRMLSAV